MTLTPNEHLTDFFSTGRLTKTFSSRSTRRFPSLRASSLPSAPRSVTSLAKRASALPSSRQWSAMMVASPAVRGLLSQAPTAAARLQTAAALALPAPRRALGVCPRSKRRIRSLRWAAAAAASVRPSLVSQPEKRGDPSSAMATPRYVLFSLLASCIDAEPRAERVFFRSLLEQSSLHKANRSEW